MSETMQRLLFYSSVATLGLFLIFYLVQRPVWLAETETKTVLESQIKAMHNAEKTLSRLSAKSMDELQWGSVREAINRLEKKMSEYDINLVRQSLEEEQGRRLLNLELEFEGNDLLRFLESLQSEKPLFSLEQFTIGHSGEIPMHADLQIAVYLRNAP